MTTSNPPLRQYQLGPLEIERTDEKKDAVTYVFRRKLYLRLTCAMCSRTLPPGATFCIECGEKV
jgi:hypothetical protein